jgi:epoxyqueuosine reductase QueG
MFNLISSLLHDEGVDLFGTIPLSECKIIKPYLLERCEISSGTAIVIASPYMVCDDEEPNVSRYAISKDYHIFYKELFDKITAVLRSKYPENKFVGFADHSPIDEIHAAAKCSLGIIGKHGLLITEKYSSFVFIATLFTDAVIESTVGEVEECEDCGLCRRACPVGLSKSECLSAMTQKKGELDDKAVALMKKHRTVWGCDVCQLACPHTQRAIQNKSIYSPIRFFNENRTPCLTYDIIENMSEEEFSERAYSWRGKSVILRNLKETENK